MSRHLHFLGRNGHLLGSSMRSCAARVGLAACVAVAASPTRAQLMLPGALHTKPSAGSDKGGAPTPTQRDAGPAKPKPVAQKPPDELAIVGRDLARDGSAGLIGFRAGSSKGIEITGLSMEGEQISRPGEPCRVDVVAGAPIEARFNGRHDGLARYTAEIEACPFSLTVLDGAVLVTREPRVCDFAVADCRVDPTGLWGPPGDTIDEGQVKQLERARAQAETAMRANFRALLATAGKDKATIKAIAGEQAGFSSQRAMTCRDYSREDVHGFCALRITQARAFALQARYEERAKDHPGEKSGKITAEKKPLRSFRSQATTLPHQGTPNP